MIIHSLVLAATRGLVADDILTVNWQMRPAKRAEDHSPCYRAGLDDAMLVTTTLAFQARERVRWGLAQWGNTWLPPPTP